MTRGIKAKIEGNKPNKVAKKTTKGQNGKEAPKKKTDVYEFIRRDNQDIYLKDQVIEKFDEFGKDIKEINNELMLFQFKKDGYDKDVEILKLRIQMLERDKRDVESAIFHKNTEKKNKGKLLVEYRKKICRELGVGVTEFGYHPDTLLVEVGNN